MPITFYTKQEYDNKMEVVYQKLFALAKKLAEAKGFQCITENPNSGYCECCPADAECPYEWKEYSK